MDNYLDSRRFTDNDFYDMVSLLEKYTLSEWISYYQQKFPNSDTFMLRKSLIWFDDAENEPNPTMLNNQTWDDVKSSISKAVIQLA